MLTSVIVGWKKTYGGSLARLPFAVRQFNRVFSVSFLVFYYLNNFTGMVKVNFLVLYYNLGANLQKKSKDTKYLSITTNLKRTLKIAFRNTTNKWFSVVCT